MLSTSLLPATEGGDGTRLRPQQRRGGPGQHVLASSPRRASINSIDSDSEASSRPSSRRGSDAAGLIDRERKASIAPSVPAHVAAREIVRLANSSFDARQRRRRAAEVWPRKHRAPSPTNLIYSHELHTPRCGGTLLYRAP
jgi:hypothetical protein